MSDEALTLNWADWEAIKQQALALRDVAQFYQDALDEIAYAKINSPEALRLQEIARAVLLDAGNIKILSSPILHKKEEK